MSFKLKNWCLILSFTISPELTALADEHASSFVPKKIISAGNHTCLLSTAGQVKCWGNNDGGGLGLESTTQVGILPETMGPNLPTVDLGKDFVVKDMCGGGSFSCAWNQTGGVKCWGGNSFGELGQEVSSFDVGGKSKQMGDNLPYTNLGTGFITNEVQCGGLFACALNTKGQVKCWGANHTVQLGRVTPGRPNIGRQSGDMGDKLPYLPLPLVKSLSLGFYHGCAATSNAVYCWGSNSQGAAGIESSEARIVLPTEPKNARKVKLEDDGILTTIHSIRSGGYHTCAEYSIVTAAKRKSKCWGYNSNGELGIGSSENSLGQKQGSMGSKLPELLLGSSNFIQMETYETSSCALKGNGTVQCWGSNDEGQLGLGDTISRGKNPEDLSNLPHLNLGLPVLALSRGSVSMSPCALLINHEVKCWGHGFFGQLGYEDDVSRGGKPGDTGDNLPFVRYK